MNLQGIEGSRLKFKPVLLVEAILEKVPGKTWEKSMLTDLSMTFEEKQAIAAKAAKDRLKKEADEKAEQEALSVELDTLMGTSGDLTRGTSHGSGGSAGSGTSATSALSAASAGKPKKKKAKKNRCPDCIIKELEKDTMFKEYVAIQATIEALEEEFANYKKRFPEQLDLPEPLSPGLSDVNAKLDSVMEENIELKETIAQLKETIAQLEQELDVVAQLNDMDMAVDSTAGPGDESAYSSASESASDF